MSPQLLDLSVELLIQILSHLSLRSIGACALTSRRLHSIISNSQYLRYLVRTEKAGVNDPFLTVLSLPERMAVLEKWERTWHVPDLRQPASQCVVPSNISVSIIRYEIHGGYLVARRRYPVDDRPVGYSYIYLHDAVKRGSVTWHDVDLLQPMSVVSYCFNVEEYNLAVMLVFNPEEDPEPHGSLLVLDFYEGTAHPLAANSTIPLQFEGSVICTHDTYDVHMQVAGDRVVVMVTQVTALPDFVFLVGWKSGDVSLVLTAPDLTYASSFALLNTTLIALVNLQTGTLEVHRILDGATCSLERVGQLCLPFPQDAILSHPASFRLMQAQPSMFSSHSPSLPFRPSPDACLVGLTAVLVAKDADLTFNWLAMRRDYLCSVADTTSDSDGSPTPWETWSARTACCVEIEHSLAAPIAAGARWLVYSHPLVARDAPRQALQDIFASQLPHCEIVSIGESRYQSLTADYEWVVGINEEDDELSRKTHRIDIHHVL
ncbi:hypothetical protein BGW80DRAFT_930164 [Lactifluus volemus]|nr:hypothetical protein BGW80DRAFT_930164 [Lactifluus volemus]